MARPSIISLELPTQGFSFQDVESSIIMFPFRRRKERKNERKKKERGRTGDGESDTETHTGREWRKEESKTLMVPEWSFVHLLHLACPSSSALSLSAPQTIKDIKYRFLFLPPYLFSLFLFIYLHHVSLLLLTDTCGASPSREKKKKKTWIAQFKVI